MKVFYNFFIVAVVVFGSSYCDVSELFPEHRSAPSFSTTNDENNLSNLNILTEQDINSPDNDINNNFDVKADFNTANLPPFPMLRLAGMDLTDINNLLNHGNGNKPYPYNRPSENPFEQPPQQQQQSFDQQQTQIPEQPIDINGGYQYPKPKIEFPTFQTANRIAPTQTDDDIDISDNIPEFPAFTGQPEELLVNRFQPSDDSNLNDVDKEKDIEQLTVSINNFESSEKPIKYEEPQRIDDIEPVIPLQINTNVDNESNKILPDQSEEQPEQPEQRVQTEEPVQSEQSEQPEQPQESEQPEQPEQLEQLEQRIQTEEPIQSEQPEQPEQTEQLEQPEQPVQPEQPEQPEQSEQPGYPNESQEPVVPFSDENVIPEQKQPIEDNIFDQQFDTEKTTEQQQTAVRFQSEDIEDNVDKEQPDESFKEPTLSHVPQIDDNQVILQPSDSPNELPDVPIDNIQPIAKEDEEVPFDLEKTFSAITPLNNEETDDIKKDDVTIDTITTPSKEDEPLRFRLDENEEQKALDDSPISVEPIIPQHVQEGQHPQLETYEEQSEQSEQSQPENQREEQRPNIEQFDFSAFKPEDINNMQDISLKYKEEDDDTNEVIKPNDYYTEPTLGLRADVQTEEDFPVEPPEFPHPESEQPKLQEIEPKQSELQEQEPEQPDYQLREPVQPEPEQPEPQQPEPEQPEPQQPVPQQSEPEEQEPQQPEPEEPEPEQQEPQQPVYQQPELQQNAVEAIKQDDAVSLQERFKPDETENVDDTFNGYHYPKPANPIVLPERNPTQEQPVDYASGDIPESFKRIDE